MLNSYVYGVKAWHVLHGLDWRVNKDEIEALLKAAEARAPPSSKRKKRPPVTTDILVALRAQLDLAVPLDAAVWASEHISRRRVRTTTDRTGLEQTVFALPRTKSSAEGEDVYWAKQPGGVDPEEALRNHFAVNNPSLDNHLFAYRHANAQRPLTKSAFLARVKKAASAAKIDAIQGHSFRIGGTLEYLLRGVHQQNPMCLELSFLSLEVS
ncbi:hypothetical protein A0H81_13224 [Grifola frondosa]|uniref:Tyr recombinase domain-containing protein n=1 Tax=Grifola frondosa TaxID=5627 RepID=A0A1C7LQ35_GRIFR|nr:hypothetical protein A0H81_13224 [Grifola frondosa]